MKMILLITLLTLLNLNVFAPEADVIYIERSQPVTPYEAIWTAVCRVESNFDAEAIGDKNLKEWSYGIAQIRQVRLDDYNERTGNSYTIKDVFDIDISKKIFMYYCFGSDMESIARSWNGSGPKTIKYWDKVKEVL